MTANSEKREKPLAVYVHVQKTGGTSVNTRLFEIDPFGISHIERILLNGKDYIENWNLPIAVDRVNWISGHVRFDIMSGCLSWYTDTIEYFSSMRDPTEQIVSHINYLVCQCADKDFFRLTEREVERNLSIAETDFTNPNDIIHMLLIHKKFLLNNQARTILGKDFALVDSTKIIQRLRRYRFIATEHNLPELIVAMGYDPMSVSTGLARANVSDYVIDKTLFYEEPLKSFLDKFNSFDYLLYKHVLETDFLSSAPSVCRPTYTDDGEFSLDNFDEEAYLLSCPDVELAVRNGMVASGRDHFIEFGQHEKRRRLAVVEPRPADSRTMVSMEEL